MLNPLMVYLTERTVSLMRTSCGVCALQSGVKTWHSWNNGWRSLGPVGSEKRYLSLVMVAAAESHTHRYWQFLKHFRMLKVKDLSPFSQWRLLSNWIKCRNSAEPQFCFLSWLSCCKSSQLSYSVLFRYVCSLLHYLFKVNMIYCYLCLKSSYLWYKDVDDVSLNCMS